MKDTHRIAAAVAPWDGWGESSAQLRGLCGLSPNAAFTEPPQAMPRRNPTHPSTSSASCLLIVPAALNGFGVFIT